MNLDKLLYLIAGLLLVGCASQQATLQSETVTVEQGEEIDVSPAASTGQESAESLKLKSDLLMFEKENFLEKKERFEQEKMDLMKEIHKRDSILDIREKELTDKTFQLALREQVIDDKLAQLEASQSRLSQSVNSSTPVTTTPTSRPVSESQQNRNSGFNKNASDLKKYRYIQFVASTGGKTYYQYAYLGEVISEQIPGKNIYRYKIRGKFDDSEVSEIIATLRSEGFHGAFEVK